MEPKISLSLLVPGAGLLTQGYCEKYPEESYKKEFIKVEWKEGKNVKHETLVINLRKNRTITQHININKEAYEHMLNTPTDVKLTKKWRTIPKKDRLKKHLDLIAEDLRAISYDYEILDD